MGMKAGQQQLRTILMKHIRVIKPNLECFIMFVLSLIIFLYLRKTITNIVLLLLSQFNANKHLLHTKTFLTFLYGLRCITNFGIVVLNNLIIIIVVFCLKQTKRKVRSYYQKNCSRKNNVNSIFKGHKMVKLLESTRKLEFCCFLKTCLPGCFRHLQVFKNTCFVFKW